jgi:anti-sigma regulatory factor (Ser/Thr protein kinase)
MPARPASVPAARRFVDDALSSWGREELLDDVGLSVSELVTNATLHSQSTHFDVELRLHDEGVHVAVEDGGAMPARSIAARTSALPAHADPGVQPDLLDDEAVEAESMTGRGLFIVAALASSWGIDDVPGGTRVWAHFADVQGGSGGSGDGQAPVLSVTGSEVAEPPGPVVRLLDCPADLLLAFEESLTAVARDLSLLSAGHESGEAARSAAHSATELASVVRVTALGWSAARLVALDAVRDGRSVVDVDLPVAEPDDLVRRVAAVEEILQRADEMAADGRLITLPAPPALRRFRTWLAAELTEQVRTGRAPVPFTGQV